MQSQQSELPLDVTRRQVRHIERILLAEVHLIGLDHVGQTSVWFLRRLIVAMSTLFLDAFVDVLVVSLISRLSEQVRHSQQVLVRDVFVDGQKRRPLELHRARHHVVVD